MAIPKIPKFKPLAEASDGTKKVLKPVLGVLLAILMGAFGLTATNKDYDVGKLVKTGSLQEAKMPVDDKGNVVYGNPEEVAKLIYDATGNFKPEACSQDIYNCGNFKYQEDAQAFYERCKGTGGKDTSRLDGDNNGVACQNLRKKTTK
jgi:hypothetical protein